MLDEADMVADAKDELADAVDASELPVLRRDEAVAEEEVEEPSQASDKGEEVGDAERNSRIEGGLRS